MAATGSSPGLIDTNVLIDALKNVPAATVFLQAQQSAGQAHVSIIAAMELVAGCRNAAELTQLRQWLRHLLIQPVTEPASRHALLLMETFSLSHGLDIPDALIAAAALEQGLPLYTLNVRHFQMIPGLTVIRPY